MRASNLFKAQASVPRLIPSEYLPPDVAHLAGKLSGFAISTVSCTLREAVVTLRSSVDGSLIGFSFNSPHPQPSGKVDCLFFDEPLSALPETTQMCHWQPCKCQWQSYLKAELAQKLTADMLGTVEGVMVTGLSDATSNGAFVKAGEYEGWPYFRNERGRYLYRYLGTLQAVPLSRWSIGTALNPRDASCTACKVTPGVLPEGAHMWEVSESGSALAPNKAGWQPVQVTLALNCGMPAKVQAQLRTVNSVVVTSAFGSLNGNFLKEGECEGWPYFKNQQGRYLYRYLGDGVNTALPHWAICSVCNPRKNSCHAHVFTADDMLPVGSKVWNVAPSLTKKPGGKWSTQAVQLSIK